MVEEGEFKKRSGDLWNRIFLQTTFRTSGHGKETVISLEGIGQLLDEAKKEFPQCLDCDFYVGDYEGNSYCTLDKEVEGRGCPKDTWFLKWFGENGKR